MFLILDEKKAFGGYFRLAVHKFLNFFSGIISGGIIDEHYMIIGVVLHNHRPNIFDVALVFDIVMGGYHNAKWQFLVFAYLVLLLVVASLFLR